MSEFDSLRIVYLLAALGLMLGTWRVHRLGSRRTLVMVLAWICIFMIAGGIAAYIDEWVHPAAVPATSPGGESNFT